MSQFSSGIRASIWPWLGSLLGMLFVASLFVGAGYPTAVLSDVTAFLGIPWGSHIDAVHAWFNGPERRPFLRGLFTIMLMGVLFAYMIHSANIGDDGDEVVKRSQHARRLMSAMWVCFALLGEMSSLTTIGVFVGCLVFVLLSLLVFKALEWKLSGWLQFLLWTAVQAVIALLYVPFNILGMLLL